MKLSRKSNALGLALLLCLGAFAARAQTPPVPLPPEKPITLPTTPVIASPPLPPARSASTGEKSEKPVGNGPAHAYVFRGLMNIFSLGMDDLAAKIQAQGVGATVYNHSEWREVADEIISKYKAGNHGAVILIGHSLGADAVMIMAQYLGEHGVPVALCVPFDGTRSFNASGNIAVLMNITQRDYAYMRRGNGFHGELSNVDVSKDESIGHISIDKTPRLHSLVLSKVVAAAKRGGAPVQTVIPASAPSIPTAGKPAFDAHELPLHPAPATAATAKLDSPAPVAPVASVPVESPVVAAHPVVVQRVPMGPSTGAANTSLEFAPLPR
ncbi:MAG TPA: hypothetical protein VKT73_07195 [Xanthobacteraceae bacterium]|nr:hypothetical protein [Xanthobacteraceae bacterium]